MSMRYKGGVISATPPTTSVSSAPGIWTLEQQLQAKAGNVWPAIPFALTWATNYGDTTTISSSAVVTATTATNSNGFGYFSSLLPSESCFFDVILATGASSSPTSVNFLGISNTVAQFNYSVAANYKAWYYSAQWFGNGTNYVTPPTNLDADTYRLALDRVNGVLYMKRTGSATVASAALPTGSNLYLMNLPQSGYTTSGATIVNGSAYSGSGGLY